MFKSLRSSVLLPGALVALAAWSQVEVKVERLSDIEAASSKGAIFGVCAAPAIACGACVPPARCDLSGNINDPCQMTGGTAGASLATHPMCAWSYNPTSTCAACTCGFNANPTCDYIGGTCDPPACTATVTPFDCSC